MLLAPDGFQALQLVQTIVPSLFLLDYHLPDMNGLEVVEKIRKAIEFARIPIILVSANLPKKGMEQWDVHPVEKPFDLSELTHIVQQLLAE